jgi:hypothetical protein
VEPLPEWAMHIFLLPKGCVFVDFGVGKESMCIVAEEVDAEKVVVVVGQLCDFGWPPRETHYFSPYYFV